MARRFGGYNKTFFYQCLSAVIFGTMVNSCCAYGCTNRMGKKNTLGFFRFPSEWKDKNRRDMWIRALRRKNWTPSANSRICGDHFVSSMLQFCYINAIGISLRIKNVVIV